MTENKRFKYSSSLEKVYDCDTYNGETTESYGTFECCEMLNELNDENEQLKKENNKWIVNYNGLNGEYHWLKGENEELKQTIETICKDYENYHGMDIRNAEWFTAW